MRYWIAVLAGLMFWMQPAWTDAQTYVLTVQGSPGTAVPVAVNPADIHDQGNGTTDFTRTYNAGANVTLTATDPFGGRSFARWIKDGVEVGTDPSVSVVMDAAHTMVAVYACDHTGAVTDIVNGGFEQDADAVGYVAGWCDDGPVSVQLVKDPVGTLAYKLTVQSSPEAGASITVSPADANLQASGTTTLERTYFSGTNVSLTAPATSGERNFVKWTQDGADAETDTSVLVNMNAAHTMVAVYSAPDDKRCRDELFDESL